MRGLAFRLELHTPNGTDVCCKYCISIMYKQFGPLACCRLDAQSSCLIWLDTIVKWKASVARWAGNTLLAFRLSTKGSAIQKMHLSSCLGQYVPGVHCLTEYDSAKSVGKHDAVCILTNRIGKYCCNGARKSQNNNRHHAFKMNKDFYQVKNQSRVRFNVKTIFPGMGDSTVKIIR